MDVYSVQRDTLVGIADSIREKLSTSDTYKLTDMAAAINNIKTGEAAFHIAYGSSAPDDTAQLWVKADEPDIVEVKSNLGAGEEDLERGISALPYGLYRTGTAAIGQKIYLFGGWGDNGRTNSILVFDTQTGMASESSAVFPKVIQDVAAEAVGNKIYLFGGMDNSTYQSSIYIYDAETDTLSELGVSLKTSARCIAAAAVEKKVYLFGGKSDSSLSSIQVFDTETCTIYEISETLPTGAYSIATAVIGNKIYLLGGCSDEGNLQSILEFDTDTYTLSALGATIPDNAGACGSVAAAVGKKVYLFGGATIDSARTDTIAAYDTESDTISVLDVTLPACADYIAAARVDNSIYVLGGKTDSDYLAVIHKFVAKLPIAENTLLIEISLTNNVCKFLPNLELGIANVYLGNAEGYAEKVPAALYQDGAWVEI